MSGDGSRYKKMILQTANLDNRSLKLREKIIDCLEGGNCGHIGSAMSLVEILRVLYDDVVNHRPSDPDWKNRDRVILSKGHGCIALYAVLADKGYFPASDLWSFCKKDSFLGGHPEAGQVPGVEHSTGALGHGQSVGLGMALAARIQGRTHRIFVIMGDGEINEGSVWEAAMCAGKHQLGYLTFVIDYNKIQSYGFTRDVQDLEPLGDKLRSFGFSVMEVDGHDVETLRKTFNMGQVDPAKPRAVICHTIKGKGLPFAENNPTWHYKSQFTPQQIADMRRACQAT